MPISMLCAWDANYCNAGLVLADGTGKMVTFNIQTTPGPQLAITYLNSPSSYNSSAVSGPKNLSSRLYLKVQDDGTNLNFWYSLRRPGMVSRLRRNAFTHRIFGIGANASRYWRGFGKQQASDY